MHDDCLAENEVLKVEIERLREAISKALSLYDAWHNMPADRGGKNGPKGRAHHKFGEAKQDALLVASGFAHPPEVT